MWLQPGKRVRGVGMANFSVKRLVSLSDLMWSLICIKFCCSRNESRLLCWFLLKEWMTKFWISLFVWASKLLLVCCDQLEESSVLNAVAVIFWNSFISRGLSFGINLPEFICFSLSDSYFALLTSLGSANSLRSFDFLMILFVFWRLWLREGMEAARSLISFLLRH